MPTARRVDHERWAASTDRIPQPGVGVAKTHRIQGKPVEKWEDAAEHMRYFTPESIAGQLIDLQTQVVQLRSTIGEKQKLPVLGLTRPQLTYRLKRLRESVAAAGSTTHEPRVAAQEGALAWR